MPIAQLLELWKKIEVEPMEIETTEEDLSLDSEPTEEAVEEVTEQFRQHMAATSNLVHYSSFEVGGLAPAAAAAAVPYLGVNVAPLGSLHCQSYYQSLSAAAAAHQGVWGSPLLPAPPAGLAPASAALNSKTTSIENLWLRAKQHAASLGLDTLPN